ncbi:hypothetical protein AMR47_01475 [Leptospira interrogans]|nr:hypothetical protein AMR47_01475 [Leptospira interrogans]
MKVQLFKKNEPGSLRRTHVNLWKLLVLVQITDKIKTRFGYKISSHYTLQDLFRILDSVPF